MTLFADRKLTVLGAGFFILSVLYAVWSYALTDPNLILTGWPPYWQFQRWMWQTFFHTPRLLTATYVALITGFFAVYGAGLVHLRRQKTHSSLQLKTLLVSVLLSFSPLLLSYNALSHDVFNYLFNAKMVLMYHANPHTHVALDFAYDPWTRFMHNTHTPAPYGYGWTALSLVPSLLGLGKFLPTWLLFRGLALVSVGVLVWAGQRLSKALTGKGMTTASLWLVFCNPLLVLEVVSNQHNDLWMMALTLGSFALIVGQAKKISWQKVILSAILLGLSTSIKFATLALLPVWGLLVIRQLVPGWQAKLKTPTLLWLASVSLFVPLFTARSQQFLPWYLTWSLVWLPFIQAKQFGWWKSLLVIFSLTAMLRYVPWLMAGGFTDVVIAEQKLIVWGGGAGLWLVWKLLK